VVSWDEGVGCQFGVDGALRAEFAVVEVELGGLELAEVVVGQFGDGAFEFEKGLGVRTRARVRWGW